MLCCACESRKAEEANISEAYSYEVKPDVDAGALPGKLSRNSAPAGSAATASLPLPTPAAQAPAKEPSPSSPSPAPSSPGLPKATAPRIQLPKLEGKISPEAYRKCWQQNASWFAFGSLTSSNEPFKERELETFGSWNNPELMGIAFTCRKGQKGTMDTAPNQDNFSLIEFKNGWRMACCMDGHGLFGQLVATLAVQNLPYLLAQCDWEVDTLPEALEKAFEAVHSNIVVVSELDGWTVDTSGCTAAVVLWKDKQAVVAHVGDSRCVIGSESVLLYETADHKPSVQDEKARIEQLGGEVHTEVYPDGWTEHRIFVKDTDKPGLSMSRSIGDAMVKSIGVVATPEVKFVDLGKAAKPFMVLASDGVWEFMSSDTVVKAATSTLQGRGVKQTAEDLYDASLQCWRNAESDYCDDISAVIVDFS